MPNKNLESFDSPKIIVPNSNFPEFSHKLAIYEKIRTKSFWYVKSLGSKINLAIGEVIAQELFRLILPNHPKTRCVEKKLPEGNRYYVASKKIENINALYFLDEKKYSQDIVNGKVKGLGSVQVISLWLNEIDFKAGNVVINKENEVIKIDGGQCFVDAMKHRSSYEKKIIFDITSQDLQELPGLINYTPYNWLDLITYRKKETTYERTTNLDSPLFNIKNNDNFKHEVNQTILRIILLPDVLINYFVKNYTPNEKISIQLMNNIIERKQQLKKAAFEMENFRIYLSNLEALEEIKKYISYLKTFKTMGKSFLLDDLKNNHGFDIGKIIYRKFLMAQETSILNELNELSNDLASFNFDPYIKNKNAEIKIDSITKKLNCIDKKYFNFIEQIQSFKSDFTNVSFADSLYFSRNKLINQLNSLKGAPIPSPRSPFFSFPEAKARKKLITIQGMLDTESNQIPLEYNRPHT